MSKLIAKNENRVLSISSFLGLNENPDGDTNLKLGELSEMRNFRITHDYHLQLRPGIKTALNLRSEWDKAPNPAVSEPRFCGSWEGLVANEQHLVCAFGGKLYDIQKEFASVREIGTLTQDDTFFFGFGGQLYLLNGHEYMSWDGKAENKFENVKPYIPTILTAATPNGVGTPLENLNRLTAERKVKYSYFKVPNSEKSITYELPEKDIDEKGTVEFPTDPDYINWHIITWDLKKGHVRVKNDSDSGLGWVPEMVVTYKKADKEQTVSPQKMRFAELYNGENDSRVFLYGDGSNKCIYSGVDLDKGTPTAAYFPDLYEAQVGDANSPVTSMIRHYGKLLAFKPEAVWSLDYTILTTATGATIPGFTVNPVNRAIGNAPMGQVRILNNNPLSIMGGNIYRWQATGNLAADHRNAEMISSRVNSTLASMDMQKVKAFTDIEHSEYWLYEPETQRALVLNFENNSWYQYVDLPFESIVVIQGNVYGFARDGRILHFSRKYHSDDGANIKAFAATGSMDFDKDWMRKYSSEIFVGLKPESGARVEVSVETDRKSDYTDKMVAASLSTFTHANFAHWSFGTNRKPQMIRLKLKVKKAAFYRLLYMSDSASATSTVLRADVVFRYTGKVK